MADKILLNHTVFHFSENDLPCLIHAAPKTGGSRFSVTMVADFFLRGSKILFLTAYPMAKDNFLKQIGEAQSKTACITGERMGDIDAQALLLESGNEKLYLKMIKQLQDVEERIVFIKNIEFFSAQVITSVLELKRVILSGDVDACCTKKQIEKMKFKSKVLFTKPQTPLGVDLPTLKKYTGYLWSDDTKGPIQIRKGG